MEKRYGSWNDCKNGKSSRERTRSLERMGGARGSTLRVNGDENENPNEKIPEALCG